MKYDMKYVIINQKLKNFIMYWRIADPITQIKQSSNASLSEWFLRI